MDTKKKILIAAAGIGAAGTIAFFLLNKKSDTSEVIVAKDTEKDVKPKKKLLSTIKKVLPAKVPINNSALPVSIQDVREPFVPDDIAEAIKDAGENKDINKVLQLLAKLKSRGDYNMVNAKFEKLKFFGNVSIVTFLLTESFTNEINKGKIRNEFLRMGLVQDKVTGKWSVPGNLSGFKLYQDIVTVRKTFVLDSMRKQKILVNPGTILGERVTEGNGMTYFKGVDGKMYSVPTQDIKFM